MTFYTFLKKIMFLSNTPMHKSPIPPVIGILSKATCRKLYEQSQWRNLGLSVWFKVTMVIVAPSNSSVYKSSFLWLEHSPFRSVVQICNHYAATTPTINKMMHHVWMIYGTELSRWKLNLPAIQQRRAWAAGGLRKYIEKTVLQLPVHPCDLRGSRVMPLRDL